MEGCVAAGLKEKRHRAEERRAGRHQNRAETLPAGFNNGFFRCPSFPLRGNREVHHQDGVLLHNADK